MIYRQQRRGTWGAWGTWPGKNEELVVSVIAAAVQTETHTHRGAESHAIN